MSLVNTVRQFIRDELLWDDGQEPLRDDLPLLELGILDSIGMLRLMAHLEQRYSIELASTGFAPRDFSTIAAIVQFARSRGVQDSATDSPAAESA